MNLPAMWACLLAFSGAPADTPLPDIHISERMHRSICLAHGRGFACFEKNAGIILPEWPHSQRQGEKVLNEMAHAIQRARGELDGSRTYHDLQVESDVAEYQSGCADQAHAVKVASAH